MTPQEFINLHFGHEKNAESARINLITEGAGNLVNRGMNWLGRRFAPNSALRNFGQRAQQAGQNIYGEAMTAPSTLQRVTGAGREAGKFVGQELGNLGLATRRGLRNTLNYVDEVRPRGETSGLGWTRQIPAPAPGQRMGDRMYRGQSRGFNALTNNTIGGYSEFNPANMAIGAGTLAAGYKGTKAVGNALFGGDASPNPQTLQDQTMANNAMQRTMQMQQPNNGGGGLGGLWNSIPMEARYAIGAGLPLMLAGGLMGGRGGMGLGALGLGAAGLGAAGAGYFGDGPRRLVGQGANALYNAFSGGANDPMSQIRTLGSLSPEFGTTALMGRMPGIDSNQARGMYDMLTQNQELIEPLLQQLQANSVGPMQKQFSDKRSLQKIGADIAAYMKQSRCWEGYEPVPGAKAYSRGSCRPVGSKKTQKEMKSGDKAAGDLSGRQAGTYVGGVRTQDATGAALPLSAADQQRVAAVNRIRAMNRGEMAPGPVSGPKAAPLGAKPGIASPAAPAVTKMKSRSAF